MAKVFNFRIKYILLVLAALLFTPFPTQLVPEWRMTVLDRVNMEPLAGVQVEVTWTNYDHVLGDGIELKRSNERGEVVFGSRWQWGNVLSRAGFYVLAKASTLVHGSDGLSVSARVWDPETLYYSSSNDQIHWYSNWDAGKPLPSQIFCTKSSD